jgi:glycosyltransferase involved in cell wall biosynthesis
MRARENALYGGAGIVNAIRLSMVTNIPAPYRVPVLNRLAASPDIDLTVLYAARTEPDRSWDLPELQHSHQFLRESIHRRRDDKFMHNNPDVMPRLSSIKPDVVMTNGFNPTHLYAFAYAQAFRKKHVAMTDGTIASEAELGWVHGVARRLVISRSAAFVAASRGSGALLMSRGAAESKIFFSPLCANPAVVWRTGEDRSRSFDLLFSGRLVAVKNPLFALDVAAGVATRLGRRVSLAMLGNGPLEDMLRRRAADLRDRVATTFAGHVAQNDLPGWFVSSRLFLFPTSWDPWGVVANEACASGLPTIISPHAGAAGELIVDGHNGYVRALDLSQWVGASAELLASPARYTAFARKAVSRVEFYNVDNAARGIASAARHAMHGSAGAMC